MTLEERVTAIERRQDIQDSYLRLLRWGLPILVGIAGIVIGRLA